MTMRVPIPHSLSKAEVRSRLKSRSHEIADYIPGGMAQVQSDWPSEDQMTLCVQAMGQAIEGSVLIEDAQIIFEIDLPLSLSFLKPIIANSVRQEGQKLISAE